MNSKNNNNNLLNIGVQPNQTKLGLVGSYELLHIAMLVTMER